MAKYLKIGLKFKKIMICIDIIDWVDQSLSNIDVNHAFKFDAD